MRSACIDLGQRFVLWESDIRYLGERLLEQPGGGLWRERLRGLLAPQGLRAERINEWVWIALRESLDGLPAAECNDVDAAVVARDAGAALVVACSDDARFAYLQARQACLRFSRPALHSVELLVVNPARGPGGYGL